MSLNKDHETLGQVFGRLRALSVCENVRGRRSYLCLCRCGSRMSVTGTALRSGNTRSCGCLGSEMVVARCTTHGHSRVSPEYRAWGMTKQRCLNPKQRDYGRYGGRGVTICGRWLEFENFLADMGPRPAGQTLERRDNNIGYEPGNCIWATRTAQTRNRERTLSLTYRGETKPLAEWAEIRGIPYSTLKARVRVLGYPVEVALTKPIKCGERP